MSTELNFIPLNELVIAETNVRSEDYDLEDVRRLAEQICAKGRIIDPLKGARKSKKRVSIHDGGRRLTALRMLKDENRLPDGLSNGVPVIFDDDDRVAQIETSIMSNERVNFSPIEECRAFSVLAQEGVATTEIANRFGIPERTVKQRLALADVHPEIIEAFQANMIDLSKLQAYTLVADQQIQARVFNSAQTWTSARDIRRMLTESEIPISASIVEFVGLDVYRDAGGTIRADLFDDAQSVCCDSELLYTLAQQQLDAAAADTADAGWKWVETHFEANYELLQSYSDIYPEPPTLSAADVEIVNKLAEDLENAYDAIDALQASIDGTNEPDAASQAALAEHEGTARSLRAQLDAYEAPVFSDEQKAGSGVILFIRNGELNRREGLVRPEDKRAGQSSAERGDADAAEDERAQDKSSMIAKGLAEDLNLAVQVSIQRCIANDEATAFVISTAWLAQCVFSLSNDTALVYPPSQAFKDSVGVPLDSDESFQLEYERWREKLGTDSDLVLRMSEWKPAEVGALHAFCAAVLYSRQEIATTKRVSPSHKRLRELLSYDPTSSISLGSDVISRFTRAQLFRILEVVPSGTDYPANAKKPELVALVAKHVGKWLPAQCHDDAAYEQLIAVCETAEG